MEQSYPVEPDRVRPEPAPVPEAAGRRAVNWPHVWAYIALSFGLAWLVDLVLVLNGGLKNPVAALDAAVPDADAGLLRPAPGRILFKESLVYYRTNRTASRWFIYYYFLMTIAYLAGVIAALARPSLIPAVSGSLLLFSVVGLLLLLVLRWRGGPQSFAGAGMAFGSLRIWLLYGLGLVLFYGLQTLLNYVFKMGTLADITKMFPPGMAPAMPKEALLATRFSMRSSSARSWG